MLLSITFVSCGDDEEMNSVMTDAALNGTWSALSLESSVDAVQTANGISQNVTSVSTGSNMDYQVTFNNGAFTAMGSYDLLSMNTIDGIEIPDQIQMLTDVSGSGTYTTANGIITMKGLLFQLDTNGSQGTGSDEEQESTYQINADGQLELLGGDSFSLSQPGATLVGSGTSSSVFERQ